MLPEQVEEILRKRYYLKDSDGKIIENWEGLCNRVAKALGDDERQVQEIYEILHDRSFMLNTPALINAGKPDGMLAACFVLPMEDSMEGIFDTMKNMALIQKRGGGTGFSFTNLRENGSLVSTTGSGSSGPIEFMHAFNGATEVIKQGGVRRGANMAILNIDHPDIEQFIACKSKDGVLANFNISVGITTLFIYAVQEDLDWNLISPKDGKVKKTVKARDLFNMIAELAHDNGEPGLIFLDTLNKNNPISHKGIIQSTNPCGEQPLLPYEACNLGSINLMSCISEYTKVSTASKESNKIFPKGFPKEKYLDLEKVGIITRKGIRTLNSVVDKSVYPIPQIASMVKNTRKVGLGIMGYADLLVELGIRYDSELALKMIGHMMVKIRDAAQEESRRLANELDSGAYPAFYENVDNLKTVPHSEHPNYRRNAALLCVAPTGTISMICETASGIEPKFGLVYTKTVMDNHVMYYTDEQFKQALTRYGLFNDDILKKIDENHGSCQGIEEIPAEIREIFVTAHDISPEWHVKVQAEFQKYIDASISKTINMPSDATVQEVKDAYMLSWKLGCKGITVYRDGCRKGQVLNTGNGEKKKEEPTNVEHTKEHDIKPRVRPETTKGTTQRVNTGCGTMYVTVNDDDHGACEIFIQMGKVGGCASAQLEAIGRIISICMRSGLNLSSIIKQIKGIRCSNPTWTSNGKQILSCGDAIAFALETYILPECEGVLTDVIETKIPGEQTLTAKIVYNQELKEINKTICPECGCLIQHIEGCVKCPGCGWSKC